MSKSANPGELRTVVYFKRVKRRVDKSGVAKESEVNVFGKDSRRKDVPVMCKWVNAHGSEVWSNMQLKLRDPATLTARYSPLLDDPALIIYRVGDKSPYEVISIDNVEQRNAWLEIKVQRKVTAR